MAKVKKYAILLVRVSTETQDYDAQISDLTNSAEKFGYTDFKVIETKETGLADLNNKIGVNELFAFIIANQNYKTVIATEMSRLGRRQSVLQSVKEWFIDNKVQLYIKDSGFWLLNDDDEITQNAEMAFTMYSLFAESEIRAKKDRFIRERKSLMEKGLSISGKLLFGYKRFLNEQKKNELLPDEENSRIVIEIFNWYLHGYKGNPSPSIKAIALHCIKIGYPKYTHSKRNVNKLLKEEAYTGFKITNNKFKNPKFGIMANAKEYITSSSRIKYPQIISQELFDAVQERLKSNRSKENRDTKHISLLSLLLKCPSCGRSLSANYRFDKTIPHHSYRCTSRSGATPCGNQFSGSMQLYDSAIWSLIKSDWTGLSKAIIEVNPDEAIRNLETQLINLEERENIIHNEVNGLKKTLQSLQSYSDLDVASAIGTIISKLDKHQKDIKRIQNERLKLDNERFMINTEQNEYNTVIDNINTIECDKQLLKDYINKFIEKIQFIEHSVEYTTLKVSFKSFGFPLKDVPRPKQKITYLMIDKKITRDIKLYIRSDYGMFEGTNYDEYFKEMVEEVLKGNADLDFKIPYFKLSF
jgi:DNA invertase Pin-like site-specific DNA recombinase